MLEAFEAFVTQHRLFDKSTPVLLAVSGGLDSVVMAHLMGRGKYPFAIAHLNYGLRGEESDTDELFVKNLAEYYGVLCHVKQVNTQQKAQAEGSSIQMVARELRYDFFKALCHQWGYAAVATAHHLTDSLETTLFNLSKGTGVHGLTGIPVQRPGIVRPMLFATRQQIQAYAHEQGIRWRHDSSNDSSKYARNKLRHQVLPVLQAINPSVVEGYEGSRRRLEAVAHQWDTHVAQWREAHQFINSGVEHLALEALRKAPFPDVLLASLLTPYGFNFAQSKQVAERLAGGSGPTFLSATHRLNIDREYLLIQALDKAGEQEPGTIYLEQGQEWAVWPGGQLHLTPHAANEVGISRDPQVALLDLGKLQWPLEIRRWREGDSFVPLGMAGTKKLSDFLIDAKVPRIAKDAVYLLCSGEQVAWVIGHRIDDRFKLTPNTQKVLRLINHPKA